MIKHILADARIIDDISGHQVKRTKHTETAYRIVEELLKDRQRGGRLVQRYEQTKGA